MSADFFIPNTSRIPLRRSNSLRVKREVTLEGRALPGAPFQRGGSFMERGECNGSVGTPMGSQIRKPTTPNRNRSLSLSLANAKTLKSPGGFIPLKTPPTSPDTRFQDWDAMSTTSTTSIASCDHASVAHNGTTFSGRRNKYVMHCSEHSGIAGDEYLTPTQRAHKQVRKLKKLLQQAKDELEQKDSDILRLTKEVVELRLYKAALNSPEDKSNSSSEPVTVKDSEVLPLEDITAPERLGSSCTDSGHFDDYASVYSKDSARTEEETPLPGTNLADKSVGINMEVNADHQKLFLEYEVRIQELIRTHEDECHEMKQKQNDRVEELLQRLSDVNARYWQLVPDLEVAKERIKELEAELEKACKKLQEQEEKQKQTYLKMYNQGHEAAKVERQQELGQLLKANSSRISVPELLHQLQATQTELENLKEVDHASNSTQPLLSTKEAVSLWVLGARKALYRQLLEARSKSNIDPEITLQFLKSAIYYFLTDKENNQGHLKAILSILGFSASEISSIDKARST